jgi:DNA invertase Pin-like site-specific DNA recombinase
MSKRQEPLHVIGYTRVSTREQAVNGHSLDAQREAIQDRADREGWEVEWASDPGCSGAYINPDLARALDMLAGGRADALVVSKLDRLARSVAHAADILAMAQAQGWNLVVLDLGIDLATPQGRALAHMLATFAELERELIRTRIRDGMAQRRREGKPLGRKRIASTAVVKRICHEREQGHSFNAIARSLTDEGIRSPEGRPHWQPSTVRRIYNSATKAAA